MRFIRIPVGVLVIFSIDLPSLTAGVLSVQPEHSFLSSDREHSIQVDHTRQTTTTILQPSPNNPAGRPENGFRIMYRWQAAPMDRDYTVFVHFVDKNGKTVFQDDHEPPTPTSKWNGFKQQYGYFECRAKFPKGPGTWPVFG